ncbi:37S ribosomal protein S5, mitochondrial [Fulvia fulva]|uniref:Small ribosomal subunit protein uS5m n=1 Tax=Passalora fulva TaxID=5499 RepID=A0A9Q8PF28_PASFU|nr:37S ribosomal protein S5, mitochondrial [Fulvia fulva]KAK4617565.1 37S ribosomal protein S5, mitochondrial [Fulvia fulva]KAK4619283.1 37S ribosomal protein S5, mitochondrial [Fulvia fulva]UJO21260.1 37S ribosomal protein S5, mitochondrial [Fulvia fulva]WPV18234.1 37S ribosomal protein S5, mitochondrial [Fulvia fulva]WPV33079.1 37S ribosomal protein S5, mitochondrial [Fulvia fulva]
MSSAQTYRCLSCRLKPTVTQTANNARRSFHSSPANEARKRATRRGAFPKTKSLASHLRPYTAREQQILARRYTPEQMNAIKLGEKAVSAKDMKLQGRFRTDPTRIDYIDDFASARPALDNATPNDAPLKVGANETERSHRMERKGKPPRRQDTEELDPHMLRLSQQTGLDKDQIRKIRVKNLITHRVVNQTRMGKIQSLYFLTIAGNQNGMVGVGEGKAAEDEDGRRQAMMNAIRNMKPIPRYEDRTIYGEVEAKVGASIVRLSSRPPGFGNRCQHLIFELARAAGITDLAARTPRSRNKMNVVKAAFQALTNQRLPDDIARARGRKLVDVRGVYYGGLVH